MDEESWARRLLNAARDESPVALGTSRTSVKLRGVTSGAPQSIPANAIRKALLHPDLQPLPLGLSIRGARITGGLNLTNLEGRCQLSFHDCTFINPVAANGSSFPHLTFEQCIIPGIAIDYASITGNFRLDGSTISGGIDAANIHVGGRVSMVGANLHNPDGNALSLDGARIEGGWFCNELSAEGCVRSPNATIEGPVQMTAAAFSAESGISFMAERMQVKGSWLCRDLSSRGLIDALSASIEGPAIFSNASLDGVEGVALVLDDVRIGGDLICDKMSARGPITALGASISGRLVMDGTSLDGAGNAAAVLDEIRVGREWSCVDGFTSSGGLSAIHAVIEGALRMRGAAFFNEAGPSLDISGTRIGGNWVCDLGFRAVGTVRGLGIHVGGQVAMNGAELSHPAGEALNLDRCRVEGGWFCDDGFASFGEVRALGASIGGQLAMYGARLRSEGRPALSLDGSNLAGGWFCCDDFSSVGEVRAVGATVRGSVAMSGASFSNSNGACIVINHARIDIDWLCVDGFSSEGRVSAVGAAVAGRLLIHNATISADADVLDLESASIGLLNLHAVEVTGVTNLSAAHIGTLILTGKKTFPLEMDGCHVGHLLGDLLDHKLATKWLDASPSFSVQTWSDIAAIYERSGKPSDATRLRWQAARRATRRMTGLRRIGRWLYAAIAGYGYYPLLASAWLLAATVASVSLAWFNSSQFVPVHSSPNVPSFDPVLYGISNVIPAATVPGVDNWLTPDSSLMLTFLLLRVFGWLQIGTLLAGLTGLLKRG